MIYMKIQCREDYLDGVKSSVQDCFPHTQNNIKSEEVNYNLAMYV